MESRPPEQHPMMMGRIVGVGGGILNSIYLEEDLEEEHTQTNINIPA